MLPFYRSLIGGRGKSATLYEIGAFLLDGVVVSVDGAGRRGIRRLRIEVSFGSSGARFPFERARGWRGWSHGIARGGESDQKIVARFDCFSFILFSCR